MQMRSSSSSMKKRTVGWRCIHIGSQVGESISIRERVLRLMKLTALRLHVAKWVLLITANYLLSALTLSVLKIFKWAVAGIIDLRNNFFCPFKSGGAAECSNLQTGLNQPAELWRPANLHTHQVPGSKQFETEWPLFIPPLFLIFAYICSQVSSPADRMQRVMQLHKSILRYNDDDDA